MSTGRQEVNAMEAMSNPLLAALANRIRHALVITDADKRIVYVNPAYQ